MVTAEPHDHCHDHSHGVAPDADQKYLTIAVLLLLGFMAVEVVVGILAKSLALISDNLHVWEVTSGMSVLSGHIFVNHDIDSHAVRRNAEAMLHDRFAITHTISQTDHATTDESAGTSGCSSAALGGAHRASLPVMNGASRL